MRPLGKRLDIRNDGAHWALVLRQNDSASVRFSRPALNTKLGRPWLSWSGYTRPHLGDPRYTRLMDGLERLVQRCAATSRSRRADRLAALFTWSLYLVVRRGLYPW